MTDDTKCVQIREEFMIKKAIRRLKDLSSSQRVVLGVEVIIPIILQSLQYWIDISVAVIFPIYAVWGLVTVLSLAVMMSEDKAKTELSIETRVKTLSDEVQTLKSEHQGLITGLGDRIDDVNRVMRNALSQLNMTLPPPTLIGRPLPVNWHFRTSEPEVTVGKSWQSRYWQFVKRQAKRIKQFVYG